MKYTSGGKTEKRLLKRSIIFLNNRSMRTLNKELQDKISPARALEILQEGNKRFVSNLKVNRNLLEQVNDTRDGQWPFAVVLSCIDSRTSAELIFDQGLGDIFSVRIAGNVVNEDILGSMEFACKVAGSKLVMVLGHTKCGAIKGACDHVEMGNLTTLLSKIEPAVNEEKQTTGDRSSKNAAFVENVSELNVRRNVEQILAKSPILEEMVRNGEIGLVGAMYDVTSGEVQFYEDTLHLKEDKKEQTTV
jgi:carbonic anhydrase